MKERNLNKTIARFSYRGKNYEMIRLGRINEFHILHCLGRKSEFVIRIITTETKKGRLIELAKNELSDIV